MKTHHRLLAFACAALMAMAMVVPVSADTSGTVNLTGMIPTQLSILVGPSTIAFDNLSLSACNPASKSLQVEVNSNTQWGISVTPSSTGTNQLPVSKLYWSGVNSAAPSCGGSSNPGKAFTTGENIWFPHGSQQPTISSSSQQFMSFALKLDQTEPGGTFNFQLVFQVTQ